CLFFFFSSRRRHTRSKRDWSSDVCSSDLFENDIGRLVGRVSRGVKRIKQSAPGAGGVDEEVLGRISGHRREGREPPSAERGLRRDRKSTRLNSSHVSISYAVFCLKKKKTI